MWVGRMRSALIAVALGLGLSGGAQAQDAALDLARAEIELMMVEAVQAFSDDQPERAADRAVAAHQRAVETLPPDDPLRLGLGNTLGSLLYALGRYTAAEPLLRDAVSGMRAALGERHPETLTSLNNLGATLRAMGRPDEAEPILRAALEGRRATLGDDHPDTLVSLNNYARLLQASGELAEAEPLLREALAGLRAAKGDRDPDTLTMMNNLGGLLRDSGRLAEAEPLYREALDGRRETLGADSPDTLQSLNNLALLLHATGRAAEAEPLLRETLAGLRAALGERHPDTLTGVNNLAVLLEALDRPADAEPLYREALEGRRATLGERHPDTLNSLNNLGFLLHETGRSAEAEPLLRDALAGYRRRLGHRHPDTLLTLSNLAAVLDATDRPDGAERMHRSAWDGVRASLGDRHPSTLVSATNLAALLAREARSAEAVSVLEQAGPGALAWVADQLGETEATEQRRRYAGDPGNFQSAAFSVALVDGAAAAHRLAAETALGWKQADGASEAILARFVADSDDPAVAEAAAAVTAARADLATASNQNADDLAAKTAALETARAALATLSADFAARERERRAGLRDVQGALPWNSVLLEYRAYAPFDFEVGAFGPRRLLAILIKPGGEPRLHDLGEIFDIELEVAAVRNFADRERQAAAAKALAARVLAPFEAELTAATTVYLAPDGPLALAPFDLLPFAGARYWIEAQDVRLISTGRALVNRRARRPRTAGLVALGGALFDAAGAEDIAVAAAVLGEDPGSGGDTVIRAGGALEPFVPLALTGPEAGAVAQIWSAATKQSAQVLEAGAARERALKSLAAPPRVLHLATHGFYAPSAERERANPMALSGLALTGANLGLSGDTDIDGEDGVLWALEAMSLPLRGAQLVALSACDTALGVADAGEGVYGLGRGFEIAGADNVLLTLWALYDDRAAQFMVDFYDTWTGSGAGDPAEALRAVKLAWIRSDDPLRSDPESWAAYRMVQNGR